MDSSTFCHTFTDTSDSKRKSQSRKNGTMPTSINSNLTACLNSFDQLKARMEQPDYRHETEVPLGSWTDELGRLRVWASNVAAYQTGQSSFDSRLGDASGISRKIKQQTTKWLGYLDEALTDTLGELSETAPSASGDEAQSDPSSKQMTRLQRSHGLVVNIINCLNQLSSLIPKPIRASFDSASEGFSVEDDEK